nr:immunoglobulin heavy chain junction region [Macaca mulatta]MOV38607.1 immunoglobulin heavy chain junction region [Macaca mulatta]MOV39642.1 immunoglobulin heavy chain junction region [Macaca mulatta]MOV39814.1 immunoglobulin heavy chain junction region [Macaca mulatta]MOV41558.1 immunoglobulin heavy chain junction region [Macaca mulatta]
CARRKDYFDPW